LSDRTNAGEKHCSKRKKAFLDSRCRSDSEHATLSYSWHHGAGEDVSSVLSVKDSDKVSGMNTDKSNSDYWMPRTL
jgi:hypothetical protein